MGDYAVCNNVMKKNLWCITHVKSALKGLGLLADDAAGNCVEAGSGTVPASALQGTGVAPSLQSESCATRASNRKRSAEQEQATLREQYVNPVPTKYWTLGSLSVDLLQERMVKLEPVCWSKPNLRNMVQRGKPGENQDMLARMIS